VDRERILPVTPEAQPLEVFFGGRPAWLVAVLGVLFVTAVGMVDVSASLDVSLAPFYLMPVLLVTWNVGRTWGIAVAGLAAVATQLADVRTLGTDGIILSWNAVVWFAVTVFVVWLLSTLKVAVVSQGRRLTAQTEASDDLREQNEVKDTLLHAVSHDLKGPLAGILGAMQTIRRAERLHLTDEQIDDLYRVIEQSGAKAARLVEDLLDLDRLSRGQLRPERESTNLVALSRRAAEEVPALEGHPVSVEGDDVLVDVDPGKVERIVENLLGNAGRHTAVGTPIHVEVRAQPAGAVLIVEDEGKGVPDEIKTEIFEPFRQGGDARGGVGIGLSLVRRFAELHGGGAHVEDRAGGGARFVVVLPGAVRAIEPASTHTLRAV
jgi:signal transduction histidine kinase